MMPSLRPRRLIRPPNPNRTMAPVKAFGGLFDKVSRPVQLKRREGPGSAIVPARMAEIDDLIFVEGHAYLCTVIGKTPIHVLCRSNRTGQGFAVPLEIKVELLAD